LSIGPYVVQRSMARSNKEKWRHGCFDLQNGGRNANTTAWVGVRDLKRWIVVTVGSHGCCYHKTASATVVFASSAVVSSECCRLQSRRHRSHEPHGSIPFRSFPFTFSLFAIFSSFHTASFHLSLVFLYCNCSREPCGTTSLAATAPSSLWIARYRGRWFRVFLI